MRQHRLKGRKFSRPTKARMALLKNLAISLFEAKAITTTLYKAKDLRSFAERVMTKVKNDDSLSNKRRIASKFFNNFGVVNTLFTEIKDAIKDRDGGYTRILKTGFRKGDCAPTARKFWVSRKQRIQKAKG